MCIRDSSGPFKTDGMLIAPCSIKTMSEIATGVTSNILTPVSYTHLDVYKRQAMGLSQIGAPPEMFDKGKDAPK